jgi:hypothetical protein
MSMSSLMEMQRQIDIQGFDKNSSLTVEKDNNARNPSTKGFLALFMGFGIVVCWVLPQKIFDLLSHVGGLVPLSV